MRNFFFPEILLSGLRNKIEPTSLILMTATESNIISMTHALSPLFPRGVLGTTVNPDGFRIRVGGQIRFEYAACGWEYF